MKARGKQKRRLEIGVLLGLLLALILSSVVIFQKISSKEARITARGWLVSERQHPTQRLDSRGFENLGKTNSPEEPPEHLFSSALRVAAIGSAYPIPYEAEICPFSNIPQPAMNQLDRDGDGITDDWELEYGLDKYNAADALTDLDEDGFSNLEEFQSKTNPIDSALHPPYVTKLRFIERKDVPFPLVFQGITKLSDGSIVFQLNNPRSGKTHFASLEEEVEGVVLQRFTKKLNESPARLFVMRDSAEIELIRGEVAADPESKAELINILDRSSIIATMGALLSLRNDEYMVLGVHPDKVVVRHRETGKVYEIIGLADGEQD